MANGKLKKDIHDLDLENWKQYEDIWTDSLWLIGERDRTGGHSNTYHGNFVPQIPNQLIRRFTRKGDVVLDPFLGLGTSLIECQRLERAGIGVELSSDVAKQARGILHQNLFKSKDTPQEVIVGDSRSISSRRKVEKLLEERKKKSLQLIVLHPPYHDIIKFSDNKKDLSNAPTAEEFTKQFGDVVENFSPLLEKDHYLAIVIGDKYTNSEWVPLGFYLMQETLQRDKDLKLKSILIKNMVNNRAKRNQESLWRYRALRGGFYVFRHEYIFLFKKTA